MARDYERLQQERAQRGPKIPPLCKTAAEAVCGVACTDNPFVRVMLLCGSTRRPGPVLPDERSCRVGPLASCVS